MYLNSFYFGMFATCEIGESALELSRLFTDLQRYFSRNGNAEVR